MTNNGELYENADIEHFAAPDANSDQQELRERYQEQLRRLSCPACGEEPFVD